MGECFHLSVVGARGDDAGWQTKGRGGLRSSGIRPDDDWWGSEGRGSGGELESGDCAGSSASVGLKIVEAKARGKEVSGR